MIMYHVKGILYIVGLMLFLAVVAFPSLLILGTTSAIITLFYRPFWDQYWVTFIDKISGQ
jgi:hypothetical protein